MRVTKMIAESVAKQLLAKKREQMDALELKMKTTARELYESYLPKPLQGALGNMRPFVQLQNYAYIHGAGLQPGESYAFDKSMPWSRGQVIKFEPEDAALLLELVDTYKDAAKKYREDFKSLEQGLINLSTYKKVQDSFPDAFVLLPNSVSTSVTIDVSELRKLI